MQSINDWLITSGAKTGGVPGMLFGLADALNTRGFGLIRATLLVRTLHPEVESIRFSWRPTAEHATVLQSGFYFGKRNTQCGDQVVEELTFSHGSLMSSETYKRSPHQILDDGASDVRERITDGPGRYPIMDDLRAAGGTDYILIRLPSASPHPHRISWTTCKEGGFTDADLVILRDIAAHLGTVVDLHVSNLITETLLSVYLGVQAGSKVLSGKIKPGDIEEIDAAIWFSDLRGFTNLSESMSSATIVGWLNEYFEVIAHPIVEHGGEILKFIGDAVLAIFPVTEGEKRAAERAFAAACSACTALAAFNAARATIRLPEMRHGIALHLGTIQYGNIGARRRLDFTVIGSAVNLASRIEGLCKSTGSDLLCSPSIARHLPGLTSVGTFPLKGISEVQEVFTPELR